MFAAAGNIASDDHVGTAPVENDHDEIDPHQGRSETRRAPNVSRDAAEADSFPAVHARCERFGRPAFPALDLDEDPLALVLRKDVDLAFGRTPATRDDAVPISPQTTRGCAFTTQTEPCGGGAIRFAHRDHVRSDGSSRIEAEELLRGPLFLGPYSSAVVSTTSAGVSTGSGSSGVSTGAAAFAGVADGGRLPSTSRRRVALPTRSRR